MKMTTTTTMMMMIEFIMNSTGNENYPR